MGNHFNYNDTSRGESIHTSTYTTIYGGSIITSGITSEWNEIFYKEFDEAISSFKFDSEYGLKKMPEIYDED